MTEKIIHLKRIKCTTNTSSASSFSTITKQDSILKKTSHKKHLSVRFSDQEPNRSLKTLSQDLDQISSAIDSTFPFKAKEVKKLPVSSQLLRDSRECISVPIEKMTQLSSHLKHQNVSWVTEKHSQSVKTFGKPESSCYFQRIQKDLNMNQYKNKGEDHKLDLKVIKKKIIISKPSFLQSKKPKLNLSGGYFHSPKVVKSSVCLMQKKYP